jgi:D-alanine-D-alanine ligase
LDTALTEDIEALKRIDAAFIALHGHGGEDGTIQKLLEQRKIPYVGSSPKASRRTFDKRLSKKIFTRFRIPTPPFKVIKNAKDLNGLRRFPLPWVVKPVRDGSSVGVFFVEDFAKSAEKIKRALHEHAELLIEKKIEGREFTVGILEDQALPVIEVVPSRDFYDFKAKYTPGMTEYKVPAPISERLTLKLQQIALKAHRLLGLRDFSRVDFMVDSEERPYVLEANSIPGLTELSLLPKAAEAAGISFDEMCYRLISLSYKRGAAANGQKIQA